MGNVYLVSVFMVDISNLNVMDLYVHSIALFW